MAGPDDGFGRCLSRLDDPIESDDSAARIMAIAASTFVSHGFDVDRYTRWTFTVNDIDLLVVLTPSSVDELDVREGTAPECSRRLIQLLKHWNHVATEPQPSIRIELKVRAARVASRAVLLRVPLDEDVGARFRHRR